MAKFTAKQWGLEAPKSAPAIEAGLLSPNEAAHYLGVSSRLLFDLSRKDGGIPQVKLTPKSPPKYRRQDLDKFIESRVVTKPQETSANKETVGDSKNYCATSVVCRFAKVFFAICFFYHSHKSDEPGQPNPQAEMRCKISTNGATRI